MKKHFTFNAWVVIFLSFVVWILLVTFGGKDSNGMLEPSLINSVIFILIFTALPVSLFGYLVVAVRDYFFRSSQMRNLAKKYSLNYTTPKEPFTITPKAVYKKNILDGKINGKNILVYDFVRWYHFGKGSYATKSATIISVDDKKQEFGGFFTGLCSVKKIDSFLAELSKEK